MEATKEISHEKQEQSPRNPTIYGRDREITEMFDFLLSDGASGSVGNMSVIAIEGVDGIGKTTVADHVYSDDRVKAHFDLRCWVEFREDLDADGLTMMILDRFYQDFHDDDNLTEPLGRLRKCLGGKKLLLVLDGFRKLAGWETVLTCFADSAGPGSAAILTTQNVDVLEMFSVYVLHLGLLSQGDSFLLFAEHAFGNRNPDSLSEMVSVGIQIVRKLGGLPLAAKTLGSLLYHHQDIHTWKKVLKMERSKLLDLKLLLMHCPELHQLPSLVKVEMSDCDRVVDSPPNMSTKHDLMVPEHECSDILGTSVAEVTLESSLPHAKIEEEGTSIMPPIISSERDGSGRGGEETLHTSSERDGSGRGGEETLHTSYLDSSFEVLTVNDAIQLINLPSRLKSLTIDGCRYLEFLPDKFLSDCSDIVELSFIDCPSLKLSVDVLHPNSLRTLYIQNCPRLEFFIPLGTHKKFAFLKYLSIINSCESLSVISMNLFPRLEVLYVRHCPNLETISLAEGLNGANLKLVSLLIWDCLRLKSFPTRGWSTPNLKSISISNCRSLKSLPNHLATLTSLHSLHINKCPELESFPDGGLPSGLSFLSIISCDKLTPEKKWKLHVLHSLTHFEIEGGCVGMESFPDMGLLPRNLKSLFISKLPSLKVLNVIGLQHLTALEKLEINCCNRLYSLPVEGGLPSSLTCLSIKGSSILTLNLKDKAGAEWRKIAHIPNVQIIDSTVHGVEKEWEAPRRKQRFWTRRISATKPTVVVEEEKEDDSDVTSLSDEMQKHAYTARNKQALEEGLSQLVEKEKQAFEQLSQIRAKWATLLGLCVKDEKELCGEREIGAGNSSTLGHPESMLGLSLESGFTSRTCTSSNSMK